MTDAAHIRLQSLEELLILCQRDYALNSLAPAIVHEFNNLMTPVLAWAQVALEENEETTRRRALEVTVTQIQKAIGITRRLVELSGGDPPRTDLCLLSSAIDNALAALVRPFAKDGIEFEHTVSPALRLRGEPLLLEQFFITLFVEVRRLLEPSPGRIRLLAEANGDGRTHITMKIRGPSLAPQRGEKALQSFLDVGAAEDGNWRRLGVGLSVARYISQLHSATIAGELVSPDGLDISVAWPTASEGPDPIPMPSMPTPSAANTH